jgi:hypothetical protein
VIDVCALGQLMLRPAMNYAHLSDLRANTHGQ